MRTIAPSRRWAFVLLLGAACSLAAPRPVAAADPSPTPPEAPAPPEPPRESFDAPEMPDPPGKKEFRLSGVTVRAGETSRGDITAFAPSGSIDGTQIGDVWLTAPTLRISGTVDGDVFFAGSQLDVTGKITKSIRSASGAAVIDGEVDGNVAVTGGTVTLGSKSHVKGNVSCFGGMLIHNGVIDGSLNFSGGTINLGGQVNEGAKIEADTIIVSPGAKIAGDVSYSSRTRVDEELQKIAGGAVSFRERAHDEDDDESVSASTDSAAWKPSPWGFGWRIALWLASFLFGCALIALFGAHEPKVIDAIRADALRCAGVGFVSILVTIAVCLSGILVLTIPFIVIYILLYVVALYLAKIPVGLWLGRVILAKFNRPAGPYAALFVGLTALYVLFSIPVLRWFVYFGVTLLGMGAMISAYLSHREARKAAAAMPPAAPPAETAAAS